MARKTILTARKDKGMTRKQEQQERQERQEMEQHCSVCMNRQLFIYILDLDKNYNRLRPEDGVLKVNVF